MKLEDLTTGMFHEMSKTFTTEEVRTFSELSLDNNPIHLDEVYAQKSIFHQRLVHGFLTGSMFSAIIGTKLPGKGSIYLNQTMNFRRPVYHNQKVVARVTVKEVIREKQKVILDTILRDEQNNILIEGEALVKLL